MTQSNERNFRGINRTICIGLGGTGRDVLMRIRRLIVDRYGDLSKLPIVSFVHIDTDKAATQVSGLRSGSTYHGVDLSFRESEKVSATMTSAEVTNFVQGMERRSNYDRQGPYDHIARWFPPQLLRNIKAVEEGAKGIRPVGRLAFFHNYRRIQSAIQTAENRTRGHEATLLKLGLTVEEGLNIFVVGSLCGGTGSGMFLDIAYSLRRAYKDSEAKIVGYLIISPELYGNTPNMIANTYAALKELNHYTTPSSNFEACYDMQTLDIVRETRPPFDYAYLVSNQTSSDYKILKQAKLCNVIAHKIALDFSGELAPVVKGMRDNFTSHMIQWDDHPRPNVQRYLTFGLAAIYFPRDIIVQIALTKISVKLVTFWLNGSGQSPDPQKLFEQFIVQYNWHSDLAQRDGFTSKLAEAVQEGNKTFVNVLNAWRNTKLEKAINECKNRDDRQGLRQTLPREFREQFRKSQPGENESVRGIWLTRLLQVSPDIFKQLKENIDEFLANLMTPGTANFSIKSGRDWLDALQRDLETYQRQLEEEIANFGGIRKLEDLEKKWRDAEQIIEDIEQKFDLPLVGGKNREVQAEAKRVVREVCDLIKHNFDLAVTQEALQIINNLQKHIRERSTQLAAFSRLVDNLKTDYEKEESDLKQMNFDEMSGEAIFEDEDIESCDKTLLPSNDFRSQLVLLSKQVTEAAGVEESIAYLMERTNQEQLQKQIDLKVDSMFGSRSNQIVKSVIKRFIQKYTGSTPRTRLAQVKKEAEPLLRLNLSDPYFHQTPAKRSDLVGFKDTDDSEVQQFKTILTSDSGISENALKPTQAEDEILIVTEYAGFPLRLISGLEGMRNPYMREQNLGGFLHNDSRILFTDIIPPDDRIMEELEDIFYPCLAFELMKENGENQQLEFQYYDELRDHYNQASLSQVWSQALEELANRRDMTEALKSLLDNAIANIERQPNLWEKHYLPKLRQFVDRIDELPEDDPNYPYRATVVGVPGTTDTPPKEGIINRFRKKMDARFKSSQQNSQQRTNTSNREIVPVDVVFESAEDSQDPRLQRELELLEQELRDDLITRKGYEIKRQQILKKYSQ
ncbi:tubulin-like doman-containing protein [Aerosakkonema sp. BLCC-F183]|uniref:tubulin-like doman-containing protein n=1 Tax=Aerosakkonema sp. BLCC-F183 TaxID=3342834 RepID=UPI0035B937EA